MINIHPGLELPLEVLLQLTHLDVWANDLETGEVVRKATKLFTQLGYAENELEDTVEGLISLVHPDDKAQVQNTLKAHIEGKTQFYECEFRFRHKSGAWVWFANNGKILNSPNVKSKKLLVGVVYDVNERRLQEDELRHLNAELSKQKNLLEELNATLRHMAMFDSLTNLPNRRLLIDRVERAITASKRSQQTGAVLFIDSDNFKAMNDSHGHQAGDLLLQSIAARLVGAVREHDTVARLSGDEFVIMLDDLSSSVPEATQQVITVVEKIMGSLNAPYPMPFGTYSNSCSVGIALFDGHSKSFDEICTQADSAMYESKRAGRNSYRLYTKSA
jgi:diguanylate cyclase (GGDEF)-like protein/PAS domain S-box-containing protein